MLADPYAQGLKLSAQGRHAQAIEQFERALAADPNDSRTLFALGNTARALGMGRPAEEFYRRVLALEPERLEALVNLANLLRTQGQFEATEALLKPALARNPEAPELWLTLGSAYREMGDAAQAKAHYREAVARRPNYAAALGNLADLLADDGEHDAAMALYDRALKAEPDNAQAKTNRAVLHFLQGNLKQGWRDYAARLKLKGKVPVADHGLPRWSGGTLRRTRLLVTAEQGVGDQIMFASPIPDLAARAAADGGSVIVECEPRLDALFARSFPHATVRSWDIEGREGVTRTRYGWLKAAGGANAFIEMGSLPRVLRNDIADFPAPNAFLRPDAAETARWRATFAALPRPLTGLCWRSGLTGGHRALQYASLEIWAAFIRELPGTPVCAQYDATAEEIAALSALSGREIAAPRDIDQKNELDRTAALLSALDAMVSAPTAASWLAAATGVATYKILYDTSWTSFGESYEPFAPAARCMMPGVRGNWAEVFAQTRLKLQPASS
ncbi:MAG: tetratricopeptide repeat protein [Alphaproteobacteria bacterium]|nr:tetratricopeptide repeat protein [Alphaproteobacteria bacterium]MDE2495097.1 tetratricopeptide repeat protein [Alphaproteobacteria bacterium]